MGKERISFGLGRAVHEDKSELGLQPRKERQNRDFSGRQWNGNQTERPVEAFQAVWQPEKHSGAEPERNWHWTAPL